MTSKVSLLTLTVIATAAITAERFITTAGAVATAAGNADGVSNTDAAIGERFPADVLGTTIVTAGAAIAANAYVEVGSAGKAITRASGKAVGKALQAATADGDRIRVLLLPNGP